MEALFLSCKTGDLETASRSLAQTSVDPNVMCTDENYVTPLMTAVFHGRTKVVSLLLADPRTDPNQVVEDARPFEIACILGNLAVVDAFIACERVDLECKVKQEVSALLFAVKTGNLSLACALTRSPRVDPNRVDRDGKTPLLVAIRLHFDEMIVHTILGGYPNVCANAKHIASLLINSDRVDVNAAHPEHGFALWSVLEDNLRDLLLEILKRKDLDVNLVHPRNGYSAVHAGIVKGVTSRHILSLFTSVPLNDGDSETSNLKLLLRHPSVDLRRVDKQGMFPLGYAMCQTTPAQFVVLANHEDIDLTRCSTNCGSLMTACIMEKSEIALMLLRQDRQWIDLNEVKKQN